LKGDKIISDIKITLVLPAYFTANFFLTKLGNSGNHGPERKKQLVGP